MEQQNPSFSGTAPKRITCLSHSTVDLNKHACLLAHVGLYEDK